MSEEDIARAGLTEREREVAELRQQYSFREVVDKLGISQRRVYEIYTNSIEKIRKYKEKLSSCIPIGLTEQQIHIYNLRNQGKKTNEIAEILGTSPNNIYKQLSLIKKTLPKSLQKN